MSKNRLIIAAAGSGKSTHIVDEALKEPNEQVLITTFTTENIKAITKKVLINQKGVIPENIVIQPWFSFLLEHGVRPYQIFKNRVTGMILVSGRSGIRYDNNKGVGIPFKEKDSRHYFNKEGDIYSDKVAKLACKSDEYYDGMVIKRLESIFSTIYIDEIQDMTGWDFEFLRKLLMSSIKLTMVGDPRQTVYSTHWDPKYKKYSNGKIKNFLRNECKSIDVEIDDVSLMSSFRNSKAVCALANQLYPEDTGCFSRLSYTSPHEGVFFVRKNDLLTYCNLCSPTHLRYNINTATPEGEPVYNMGESKGLEFDHVLIHPTKDMLEWLIDRNAKLKPATRSKLYVAITRAFFSVGFVVDDSFEAIVEDVKYFSLEK